ncbi:MAG TPA: hypothetical protein VLL75_20555 [Vicinamibacteria bacterium]|nr:hypothetical protein [Vicinamibacteria bacterium]
MIGGDGSLSGADALRQEWKGLVDELVASGRFDAAAAAKAISSRRSRRAGIGSLGRAVRAAIRLH